MSIYRQSISFSIISPTPISIGEKVFYRSDQQRHSPPVHQQHDVQCDEHSDGCDYVQCDENSDGHDYVQCYETWQERLLLLPPPCSTSLSSALLNAPFLPDHDQQSENFVRIVHLILRSLSHLLCCLKSCSWLGSSCIASQSSSSGLRRSRTSPRCSTHTSRLLRAHRDKFSLGQYFSFLFACLSKHHPSSSVSPIFPFFPFYLFLSSLSCLCPSSLFPSSSKVSLHRRLFSADFASRVFPFWIFEAFFEAFFEASFSHLLFLACLSSFPEDWWAVM